MSAVVTSDLMSTDKSSTGNPQIIVTVLLTLSLAIFASFSAQKMSNSPGSLWVIWLAVSVGGLGGIVHEIAQSRGKILSIQRAEDGIYLGTIAGMVMGAVAGLLAVQGLVVHPAVPLPSAAPSTPAPTDTIQFIYIAFLAGLGLKGVMEAVAGQPVLTSSQQPSPNGLTLRSLFDSLPSPPERPTRPVIGN